MFFLVFEYATKCSMRNPELALTLSCTGLIIAAQYYMNQTAPEPNRPPLSNANNRQGMFSPDNGNSNGSTIQEPNNRIRPA